MWHPGGMTTRIRILTTGGTIACTQNPATGALEPTLSVDDLIGAAGLLSPAKGYQISGLDLIRLDSSSITLADLDLIAAAVRSQINDGADGVVVTHGTDSLEDTVLALDLVHDSDVPVVLTGSMLPFDATGYDGIINLRGAVHAAADPANRGRGALISFASRLLPARGVLKAHTSDPAAFHTRSPLTGQRPAPVRHRGLGRLNVPIIAAWPGAPGDAVDAAVKAKADGIVVEALGAGNVSVAMGEAVARALKRRIPVVIATRVPYGPVSLTYGGAGGGSTLGDLGALSAGVLGPGQARITLATALAARVDPATLLA